MDDSVLGYFRYWGKAEKEGRNFQIRTVSFIPVKRGPMLRI